ncbi:rho guanine nucleotide exchange factor 18, partial [Pseudochaenichthys georgianus]|uniref:rho guanine nucleotide exchange factor 18 n=1 Tax=Pseudochaenichthys georgianus TaxID=52239 RepID=UPI00146CCFF8
MADSPLNHSWPSFSKLWMKRWSFKRASECKPCIAPCGSLSVPPQAPFGTGSSSSLSPPSIAEDAFFGSSKKDKDACSVVSDYDCPCAELSSSVEDLLDLSYSLKDSEYFKDLEGGIPASFTAPTERNPLSLGLQVSRDKDSKQPTHTSLSTHSHRVNAPSSPFFIHPAEEPHQNFVVTQLRPKLHPGCIIDSDESSGPAVGLSLTINLNGLPGSMETAKGITGSQEETEQGGVGLDGELDEDSFPILVRSMSTSRRHSLGVLISPITLGRSSELILALTVPLLACGVPRRHLYARSEILATDECSRAAHISRVVQTSKQAARAAGAEEFDPEENLHSTDGQSHMLMVQKVLQELKLYHGAKQGNNRLDSKVTGSVTWYEFLSNENEEEDDRTEKVEKGTKVKRTLSSLRNRVTGSFNKDKGKNREKEHQKEKEKDTVCGSRRCHGHHLVPGSFSSCATCSLCSKTLQRKHGLQCMNCAVNVHKSCKSLLGECSSRNKRDSHPRIGSSGSPNPALKHRDRELTGLDGHPGSLGTPGMTISPWGNSTHTHSSTAASSASLRHNNSSGSLPGEMDETDALRSKRCNEDAISLAPSTTESIIVEDAHYAAVRADLESDAQDLEAESWSSAVDQPFVKKHPKQMVKRQDVIYELMQTEMHHVRTLKIMLRVYVRELKENLQMDPGKLDCLFPRLENLLELHTHFLSRLKERRRENLTSPNERNYSINRVADILITQFSGEVGGRMKESYGDFCSHHTEAVSYYKEQLHNNKKFQNVIRKVNNLSIVRRLGVSECILLVTQRIMKYPVLVERIILNTEAGTEEHEELTRALGLIKDTIVQVDTLVNVHEKSSRLQDIHNKMEPKALGKIKDDRVFRREDLADTRRRLLHEGTVNWKAASGRLK